MIETSAKPYLEAAVATFSRRRALLQDLDARLELLEHVRGLDRVVDEQIDRVEGVEEWLILGRLVRLLESFPEFQREGVAHRVPFVWSEHAGHEDSVRWEVTVDVGASTSSLRITVRPASDAGSQASVASPASEDLGGDR